MPEIFIMGAVGVSVIFIRRGSWVPEISIKGAVGVSVIFIKGAVGCQIFIKGTVGKI